MKLFEDDFGTNEDPVDNTEITTTLLYYSKDQLAQFKKLCKIGIKKEFGNDAQDKGNIPDLLLKILEQLYGNPTAQKHPHSEAVGSVEG